MIETSVMYVRIQTSVNVFRIEATAITIGIATPGCVPKTNRRMTSAPRPPISASVSTLGPVAATRRVGLERIAAGQVDRDARAAPPP